MSSSTASAPQRGGGTGLELPASGVGSAASIGSRVLAFVIDIALSAGVAALFTLPDAPKNWSLLVWAVMTVLSVGLFGFTPGQWLMGIRVAVVGAASDDRRAGLVGWWAVPRTALTFLLIPVLLMDANGRGLHDRLCRTVVVRAR
ncbi:RDD family protein [Nakamurella aerolata]|uniref:RDD domain-containing protein n=1 Tax=Nakamurella aerolata TaxID=1656892 RepID=A0A849ACQ8_9ACTN|nr:RDD family protein [Nakamurella aerolata]NNG37513.1 hypothetical protein [Nakamurella aerolata]